MGQWSLSNFETESWTFSVICHVINPFFHNSMYNNCNCIIVWYVYNAKQVRSTRIKFHYLAHNGDIWNFHLVANLTGSNSISLPNCLTITGDIVYYFSQWFSSTMYRRIEIDNVDSTDPCFERLNEDLNINICGIAIPFSNGHISAVEFLLQDLGEY